jgi:hypothetical protein
MLDHLGNTFARIRFGLYAALAIFTLITLATSGRCIALLKSVDSILDDYSDYYDYDYDLSVTPPQLYATIAYAVLSGGTCRGLREL